MFIKKIAEAVRNVVEVSEKYFIHLVRPYSLDYANEEYPVRVKLYRARISSACVMSKIVYEFFKKPYRIEIYL